MLDFMSNGGITLNRGDHESMTASFGKYQPTEEDTLLFTLKAEKKHTAPIVKQKQFGPDGLIVFYKADTIDLPLSEYWYDIKILDKDEEPIFQHDPLPFLVKEVL